ncbi:TIM barrel protein [Actinoplanes sp. NPDC049265]|uniref:TIM barrel protein n=1 Tax=Actinoplanes sp. NPDC049265 TaxID=3363902 RepID=UPI003722E6C5
MGYRLSACLDLLFTENRPDIGDRVRAAADAGLDAVEIWGLQDKNIDSLKSGLTDTGVELLSLVVEPRTQFMLDPRHEPFYEGLQSAADAAEDLGCPYLVVTSGIGNPGVRRAQQLDQLVEVFAHAADLLHKREVTLLLENVNTRVDHPGSLLDRTSECADVVRRVASPRFRLLYDLYHSVSMAEDVSAELDAASGLVAHIQIADTPDRTEPGSGTQDWPLRLRQVRATGYDGVIGLEYRPTSDTVRSLDYIREVASTSW